ncbi:glycoside hydrolase family 13 protein [Micromonospora globbae]|uniref:Glycoside hydrolase family 13 protein n=1 Tax=Micromonospora globbae TaxID=1894969 RepID=A0ABZ1S3B0_9ACTN|nr:alpha-amylase family glycosyl hydrolase [Micromonospora globbae]
MSTADDPRWWRSAVIYQIYPRSFADADGDGIGDLAGIRQRLAYLAGLGVDAVWFSPWYPSPMADAGYDVSDYRDIDPVFGTLAEAEELIAQAHRLGLRVIIDLVPNHCSEAHPWFQAALASPDAPERELFWFRPGRGPDGSQKPTDWVSPFGGDTWTRTTNPDGTPGDWYLHLFAPQQPDFNWDHPRVRAEFEDILRFWLDRGIDGIRIDSAAMLAKDPALPEATPDGPSPFIDLDAVHEIYRSWRRIVEEYPGGRALIGEVWLPDQQRFANYLRPDELHAAFNFDFLGCAWDPVALRACIDATLAAHLPVGAPATWVLSNHDVTRHVTRYGREDTTFSFAAKREGIPSDLELGTRRARAAALLSLSLPGAAYVYQGEELGLWEVEDIPPELRQDPMYFRSGGVDPGRDGCRVPLPWSGETPPFGFSPDGATARPWLPQPADWKDRTAEAQAGDERSMLELYRAAIAIRRAEPALGDGELTWLPAPDGVLAYQRSPRFTCVVNLAGAPVPLPPHTERLLASGPLDDDLLPPDTAVWLRTTETTAT